MQCPKCRGRGRLPWFKGYNNGVCFECNGTGHILPKLSEFSVRSECPKEGIRWNWFAKRSGSSVLYSVGRSSDGTVYIYNNKHSHYCIPNEYRLTAREAFKIV